MQSYYTPDFYIGGAYDSQFMLAQAKRIRENEAFFKNEYIYRLADQITTLKSRASKTSNAHRELGNALHHTYKALKKEILDGIRRGDDRNDIMKRPVFQRLNDLFSYVLLHNMIEDNPRLSEDQKLIEHAKAIDAFEEQVISTPELKKQHFYDSLKFVLRTMGGFLAGFGLNMLPFISINIAVPVTLLVSVPFSAVFGGSLGGKIARNAAEEKYGSMGKTCLGIYFSNPAILKNVPTTLLLNPAITLWVNPTPTRKSNPSNHLRWEDN